MSEKTPPKKVLFFSSVKDINEFSRQKFYLEDITILKSIGLDVSCTNRVHHFLIGNYDFAFLYFYKWSTLAAFFAKIRFKKIAYTGGIDDLSPFVTSNRFKRSVFQLIFTVNYFMGNILNIVSVSDYLNINKLYVVKYFEKYLNKLMIFPHSVDFHFTPLRDIKIPHSFVTICWMETKGNVLRKGLDKALFFFYEYLKVYPDAKLYIIGKVGEGSEYLRSLEIFKLVQKNIEFLGFIDEKSKFDILNRSTFYLQFSSYEGFGVAALEANISRCFVLHSGSGGFLSSQEIWGKCIRFNPGDFSQDDLNWIYKFSYHDELHHFEKTFQENFFKFSRSNRILKWKIFINE